MSYCFSKILIGSNFDESILKVTDELKKEGFGILSEIDVKKTLKKKLDVDFKRYIILGACYPQSAYEALQVEDKIGVFLPCNIVVEEHENGEIEVSAIDPMALMMAVDNDTIGCISNNIRKMLIRVIDNLS